MTQRPGALGRFTPGPVFTTATFVGSLVASWPVGIIWRRLAG